MSGAFQQAVRRSSARPAWFARGLVPAGALAAIVYAGLLTIAGVFLSLTWKFPVPGDPAPEGLRTLASWLLVLNGFWLALLVADGVRCMTNPARRKLASLVVLAAAFVLVCMLQRAAWLLREVALA